MAKILKAKPQELDALFALTSVIPPGEVLDAGRLSNFRRVIKIAMKPYNDGVEVFLSVLREDAKKFTIQKNEKELELTKGGDKKKLELEIKDLVKALDDINEDFNQRMETYRKENNKEIVTTFDNEVYLNVTNLFSKIAPLLFIVKNEDGKDSYDASKADALFELLEKAV